MTKSKQIRSKIRTAQAAVMAMLLLDALLVAGQSTPPFPSQTKHVRVKIYKNATVGFELSYPSTYRREESPFPSTVSDRAERMGYQVLMHAVTGKGEARCEDEGECDQFGRIIVAFDRRPFELQTIVKYYGHTGWDEPLTFRLGAKTLYYMGTGGGGVTYPDTFFYNLDGSILIIEFDGPYPQDSRSPSDTTRRIEKVVLESLRVRRKPVE